MSKRLIVPFTCLNAVYAHKTQVFWYATPRDPYTTISPKPNQFAAFACVLLRNHFIRPKWFWQVSALYNLTADPNEYFDLSFDFPDVFQALHRRISTKYWAKVIRAKVTAVDSNAFIAWREDGSFVGPWLDSTEVNFCSTIAESRRLYEAEAGLGNCSLL